MIEKKLVIFAGSQEIQDSRMSDRLSSELESFLDMNRAKISEVLFGGGNYGVM